MGPAQKCGPLPRIFVNLVTLQQNEKGMAKSSVYSDPSVHETLSKQGSCTNAGNYHTHGYTGTIAGLD